MPQISDYGALTFIIKNNNLIQFYIRKNIIYMSLVSGIRTTILLSNFHISCISCKTNVPFDSRMSTKLFGQHDSLVIKSPTLNLDVLRCSALSCVLEQDNKLSLPCSGQYSGSCVYTTLYD